MAIKQNKIHAKHIKKRFQSCSETFYKKHRTFIFSAELYV